MKIAHILLIHMVKKHKQIVIRLETYEALMNLGTMRDTFDSVITRLMADAKKWKETENMLRDLPPMAQKSQNYRFMLQLFKDKGLLE